MNTLHKFLFKKKNLKFNSQKENIPKIFKHLFHAITKKISIGTFFFLDRKSVHKSLNQTCLIHFHLNKKHFYKIWKPHSDKITNALDALPKPAPQPRSEDEPISGIHKTKQPTFPAPPSTSRSSIMRFKQ